MKCTVLCFDAVALSRQLYKVAQNYPPDNKLPDYTTDLPPQKSFIVRYITYERQSTVVILPVQAVAEDVFIWSVRPRRIVNFSF